MNQAVPARRWWWRADTRAETVLDTRRYYLEDCLWIGQRRVTGHFLAQRLTGRSLWYKRADWISMAATVCESNRYSSPEPCAVRWVKISRRRRRHRREAHTRDACENRQSPRYVAVVRLSIKSQASVMRVDVHAAMNVASTTEPQSTVHRVESILGANKLMFCAK